MAKKKPYWGDTGDPSAVTATDTGTGEDQGFLGQARHDIAAGYDDLSHAASWLGGLDKGWDILGLGGHPKSAAPAAPTGESAYQQLADAQANQYLQMTKNLDPLTSGASLPAIEATASDQASQMLGASATSPVSQWLNAQTQAAQAQNAPAAAAASQVAGAQDQAAQLEAAGLKNMGAAENQMMQAAPYQQLLQSLAQDVPYKLLSNYTIPEIQQSMKSAESQLGLSTAGTPTAPTPNLPSISSGIIPPAATTVTGPPGLTG
jgi:hypothetical protein